VRPGDVHEITTFFHGSVSKIYPDIEKPYDIRSSRFYSAESMNAGDERWERGEHENLKPIFILCDFIPFSKGRSLAIDDV
jgi:hypothetical protein